MPAILTETQETNFETQKTDVEDPNIARLWFKKNAWYNVPVHDPPSSSRSSSEVQDARIGSLKAKLPTHAFQDKEKVERLIAALDDSLGDTPLQGGSVVPLMTDEKEIEAAYKELFSPECESHKGVRRIEWRRLANEVDSYRLTANVLMNAIVEVTKRMYDEDITVESEPLNDYQDQTTKVKPRIGKKEVYDNSKGRVDMVVVLDLGEDNEEAENSQEARDRARGLKIVKKEHVLFLIEGKNPNVIEALARLFKTGRVIELDLFSNSTNGRKILNKLIYYMLFWDIPRLVVTSFSTTFILELHNTKKGCFVSYSPRIDTEQKTHLFRALLGLTLVSLGKVDYMEFDADAAFALYKKRKAVTPVDRILRSRSGGGRGGCNGFRTDFSNGKKGGSGGGKPTKKMSSISGGGSKKGPGDTGIKRPLGVPSADGMVSAYATGDGFVMTPDISPARTNPSDCDNPVRKGPGKLAIRLEDSKVFTLGSGLDKLELVRDANVPFSVLPTSDRMPCLMLQEEVSSSSAGTVYFAELRAPWEETQSNFIVKVVNARLRSHEEYRNAFKQLVKEYETYYLLGKFKRDNKFVDIVESTTPICYGLYKARSKRDIFALVIEYAGQVTVRRWREWPIPRRIATLTSILSLHSLGLIHGDTAERNVALKCDTQNLDVTAKFFDFDNSSWHDCPGIEECEELDNVWNMMFPDDIEPYDRFEFEERSPRLHGLPFCNMRMHYPTLPEMEGEVIIKRLKELWKNYDREHAEDTM